MPTALPSKPRPTAGAATAAFLRPGVRSVFPSRYHARSALAIGVLAAGSILAASTLTNDGGAGYVAFMEAHFGPQLDAIDATASRASAAVSKGLDRVHRLAQDAVVAIDGYVRPEDYEESPFPEPAATPTVQPAVLVRPAPAPATHRHVPGQQRPHKRSRRAVHHRRPEADEDALPSPGFPRP